MPFPRKFWKKSAKLKPNGLMDNPFGLMNLSPSAGK
jgi:hypothetical protein